MNYNLDIAGVKNCIQIRVNLHVSRKIMYDSLFNVNSEFALYNTYAAYTAITFEKL